MTSRVFCTYGLTYPRVMDAKDLEYVARHFAEAAARSFEQEGADALVLSGGFVSKTPMYIMRGEVPYREFRRGQEGLAAKIGLVLMGRILIKKYPFEEAYFLSDARRVRAAVRLPSASAG